MLAPNDKRLVAVAMRVVAILVVGPVLGLLAESACEVSTGPLSDAAVVRAAIDACKRAGFQDVGDGTLEGQCSNFYDQGNRRCQVRDISARVVCYDLSNADPLNGIEGRCAALFAFTTRSQKSGTWLEWVDYTEPVGWYLLKRSGQWQVTINGAQTLSDADAAWEPLDNLTHYDICNNFAAGIQ